MLLSLLKINIERDSCYRLNGHKHANWFHVHGVLHPKTNNICGVYRMAGKFFKNRVWEK